MFDIQYDPVTIGNVTKTLFELFGKGYGNLNYNIFEKDSIGWKMYSPYFTISENIPENFNWYQDFVQRTIYFNKEQDYVLFKLLVK